MALTRITLLSNCATPHRASSAFPTLKMKEIYHDQDHDDRE